MAVKQERSDLNSLGLRVADHVTAMLAYWDKDLICRFVNAAYLDWFGKKKEEMIGKITLPDLLGDLYEKNLPYINGALAGQTQVIERDIATPSGIIRHSLATYIPDITGGVVNGFFVHVADVTSLKQLEKELVKGNSIINDQNKRLLNFTNVVSHNLRSYAGNLKQLLALYESESEEKEKATILGHLKSVAHSFASTVKNLSEVVHVQNLSSVKGEEVSVKDYIQKVLQILRAEIASTNAVILNNTTEEARIISNPAYLESIILNLLSNALRYRSPERPAFIRIDTIINSDEVVLKVSDNGLGIDLSKYGLDLFGMYKTFHSHPESKGIGLFITRFQVESMGGRIEIKSEVDVGSTFLVYFPK
jgi:PAS domain S-box-containing protein